MKNKKVLLLIPALLLLLSPLLLLAKGKNKGSAANPTPTPTIELTDLEIPENERPVISLTPYQDGHWLKLKISAIPEYITDLEYELTYLATDESLEIEKGLGDTIKLTDRQIERELLLGTESCTNGCKYKYDAGVTGGNLRLTFINQAGQAALYEAPFTLKSGRDLKSEGNTISIASENYSLPVSAPKTTAYYILLKDYGPNPQSQDGFSLFDSSQYGAAPKPRSAPAN